MATACRCICGESFAGPASLEEHGFANGHKYRCCNQLFKVEKTLTAHRHSGHHIKGESAVENLALRTDKHCSLCSKGGLTDSRLQQHMLDRHKAKVFCPHCPRKGFKDDSALAQHIKGVHHPCPHCLQTFRNSATLFGHQKTSNHLFCLEHDLDFTSASALNLHLRENAHIGSFECTACDRAFKTDIALNNHLDSIGHARVIEEAARKIADAHDASTTLARHEEKNLFCELHNQKFKHVRALQQHSHSVKHKPLSELRCPLSNLCGIVFTSPSALLLHLESNTCKSGMTREKLNAVVGKYDTNRHITAANSGASLTFIARSDVTSDNKQTEIIALLDGLSISDASGVVLTPTGTSIACSTPPTDEIYTPSTVSERSGVMLTPSASIAGSESVGGVEIMRGIPIRHHAAQEWSFLNGVVHDDMTPPSTVAMPLAPNAAGQWACHLCPCTFRKPYDLQQHLSSVAHAPSIFHCPTALLGLSSKAKGTKSFKTLSGLAQHLEAGACTGGTGVLGMLVQMVEREIEKAGGGSVKLLK